MSSAARVTKRPKLAAPLPPAVPTLPVRRYTLDEYHHLIEIGFFREDDRIELLNGWIIGKMGINPPHASALTRLSRRLRDLLGEKWIVREQSSLTIPSSDSEPEPDIAVALGPEDTYDERHPVPKDVVLVVEVADSSLAEDQGEKLQAYAAAKVIMYWIVNLIDRRVEVYTGPRGGNNPIYKRQANYGPGDEVPLIIRDRELGRIPVNELLP
jgi:Uma2 family endonuclease